MKYQIMMIGNHGVGKTKLVDKFIKNVSNLPEKEGERDIYVPTSFCDPLETSKVIDGENCDIKFLEISNQVEFSNERKNGILESDGFLVVFSDDRLGSKEEVSVYINEIRKLKDCIDVPIVLCKNKCDREDRIDLNDLKSIAERHGIEYSATSAVNRLGVDESFHKIIRKIRAKRESSKSLCRDSIDH